MSELGYGIQFQRSADGSVTWDQVAGMIDVDPGSVSRGSTDQTTIDGTTGYKEFAPAPLRDAGAVSITLLWDPADPQQVALVADLDADENGDYRIVYPNAAGTTVTFSAHITEMGEAIAIEDRITRKVAFKISGKPVVT